jgi:hypothetical protein
MWRCHARPVMVMSGDTAAAVDQPSEGLRLLLGAGRGGTSRFARGAVGASPGAILRPAVGSEALVGLVNPQSQLRMRQEVSFALHD